MDKEIKLIKNTQKEQTKGTTNTISTPKIKPIGADSPIIRKLREAEEKTRRRNTLSDEELIELEFKDEAQKLRLERLNNKTQNNVITPLQREQIQRDSKIQGNSKADSIAIHDKKDFNSNLANPNLQDIKNTNVESKSIKSKEKENVIHIDIDKSFRNANFNLDYIQVTPTTPTTRNISEAQDYYYENIENITYKKDEYDNARVLQKSNNFGHFEVDKNTNKRDYIAELATDENSDENVGIYIEKNRPRFDDYDNVEHKVEIVDKISSYDLDKPHTNKTKIYAEISGIKNKSEPKLNENALNEMNATLIIAQKKLEERLKLVEEKQKRLDMSYLQPNDAQNTNENSNIATHNAQKNMWNDSPHNKINNGIMESSEYGENKTFLQNQLQSQYLQTDLANSTNLTNPALANQYSFNHSNPFRILQDEQYLDSSYEGLSHNDLGFSNSYAKGDEDFTNYDNQAINSQDSNQTNNSRDLRAQISSTQMYRKDLNISDMETKIDKVESNYQFSNEQTNDNHISKNYTNLTNPALDTTPLQPNFRINDNAQNNLDSINDRNLDDDLTFSNRADFSHSANFTSNKYNANLSRDSMYGDSNFNASLNTQNEISHSSGIDFNTQNVEFTLPSTELLNPPPSHKFDIDDSEIDLKVHNLFNKLKVFKIEGDIVRTYSGPVVTTFEFRPAVNVKVSRIQNLQDDLSMALKATSIRIQAPIPGKDVVGIEIPNNKIQTIYLREIFESKEFKNSNANLAIVLGKDVVGNPVVEDLATLPHLLIAGTTGSGKSVGINAMILSLLYKNTPKDLRLIMIDPKILEFGLYEDIPHLLTPIITDPKKAIIALSKMVDEMNRRYEMMNKVRVKNIVGYNLLAKSEGFKKLPYIVVIIDEFADLMIMGGREAENSLISLAGKARASGIHLIIATQRPTVNVVTGLIKGNLPSKISYRVGSKIDSKVILDELGAESLLGKGDMLFSKTNKIVRLHAPYNDEKEIENVVNFIKSQQEVEYDELFSLEPKEIPPEQMVATNLSSDEDYKIRAKEIILQTQKTSISYIQRQLGIGFNKAAKIIEELENDGFLSPPNSKGTREIIGN